MYQDEDISKTTGSQGEAKGCTRGMLASGRTDRADRISWVKGDNFLTSSWICAQVFEQSTNRGVVRRPRNVKRVSCVLSGFIEALLTMAQKFHVSGFVRI